MAGRDNFRIRSASFLEATDRILTPTTTAVTVLLGVATVVRNPIRWALALSAGFIAGRALHNAAYHNEEPLKLAKKVAEDRLVTIASDHSFPASDSPSYTLGRGKKNQPVSV